MFMGESTLLCGGLGIGEATRQPAGHEAQEAMAQQEHMAQLEVEVPADGRQWLEER
jgi:hypothetical protein